MTARKERFTIVAIVIPSGIDEAVAALVSQNIDEFDTDYWLLFQPDSYLFFFRESKRGKERANRCITSIETLRSKNERLSALRVGQASGELVADFSWFGSIKSLPVGTAVNEAHVNARKTVSLDSGSPS
jgi:hypothetical protein